MNKGINEFKKSREPRAYVIKKSDGTIIVNTSIVLSIYQF